MFLGFIFIACSLSAQTQRISGIILNASNDSPIAYASVRVCESSIGVVSNEFGEFSLYLQDLSSEATICINYLGYNGQVIKISDWGEGVRQIRLNGEGLTMDTLFVEAKRKKLNARKIIRQAFANISKNYPQEPFKLRGFYRDYQKENERYLNVLESALEVYDPGFMTEELKKSQYRLLHLNLNKDFEQDSILLGDYVNSGKDLKGGQIAFGGTNEFTLMRLHDPIRNHKWKTFSHVYIMTRNFLQNHEVELTGATQIEGKGQYEISFTQKKSQTTSPAYPGNKYYASGKMYIQADNFAITDFNYIMDIERKGERNKMFEVKLRYSEFQSNMYLDYLSFSNYFEYEEVPDSALFNYSAYMLSPQLKLVAVEFSDPFDLKSAQNKENYQVSLRGISCPIQEIQIEDQQTVYLKILAPDMELNPDELLVEAKGVQDFTGKSLGEVVWPEYVKNRKLVQFREFFVSEVITQDVQEFEEASLVHKTSSFRNMPLAADKSFWETFNRMSLLPMQE